MSCRFVCCFPPTHTIDRIYTYLLPRVPINSEIQNFTQNLKQRDDLNEFVTENANNVGLFLAGLVGSAWLYGSTRTPDILHRTDARERRKRVTWLYLFNEGPRAEAGDGDVSPPAVDLGEG